MKLAAMLLASTFIVSAQEAPPAQTLVTPLGIPCEPGQPGPFGPGFPLACPPVEQQGAMIFVKWPETTSVAYKVTVNYTTTDGQEMTSVKSVARSAETEYSIAVFQIGRLKTDTLSGNTISSVTVELAETVDPPPPPPETEN
ncbi:MAG: hypothetical protein HYZ37_05800 [Candidatus Solibacter usitatus]|nr:hypothetical protein [Candidatus Solibacter usitatus]